MVHISRRAASLQESAIRKLDQVVVQQKAVSWFRLNIGQPDIATPEPLLKAIRDFQPKVVGYGPASGLPACREAAAAYHARWGPGLEARHVAVTQGGSEALLFAFTLTCDPGDEILVPEPYYTNYAGFATFVGASVRGVPTRLEQGFEMPDNDILDSAVTPRTRAIVFANPGNPTGAVYGRDTIERVLKWARSRGLFVIADEVYRRIWFDAPPTSALEFPDHHDHVIVVDSVSKTFSLCGIRLGFLISRNEEILEKAERLGQARLGTQPLAQHVGLAAFALPESYYEEVRGIYAGRVAALAEALGALPGVSAHRPQGAFYCMANLPVDDSEKFARWLITDFRRDGASVVVAPGPGFYTRPELGRHQVRLAAVSDAAVLRDAIGLLGEALRAFPG